MNTEQTNETAGARPENDAQLIAWLNKRLEKSLPLDQWQRDQLIKLLCSLRALEAQS